MKPGDIVRHKTDDEVLRVKKVGRDVCTCEEFLKPKKRNVMGELVYPVRVCLIENIIIPK